VISVPATEVIILPPLKLGWNAFPRRHAGSRLKSIVACWSGCSRCGTGADDVVHRSRPLAIFMVAFDSNPVRITSKVLSGTICLSKEGISLVLCDL